MDIRCGSCTKLFRVGDEKIAGKGIRFKCSRCGEVITITKQDLEMDLLAREGGDEVPAVQQPVPPPPPRPAHIPAAEAQEYRPQQTPAQTVPSQEFQPQEYQPTEAPQAGLDDFDFSDPHAAAFNAGQDAAQEETASGTGGDFSFATETEQEAGAPEISISEDEAKDADAAFSFPDDLISEPQRKPAFSSQDAEPELGGGGDDDRVFAPDAGPAPDLAMPDEDIPDLRASAMPPAQEPEKGPAFTLPPKTGPVFTPPPKQKHPLPPKPAPAPPQDDDDIDLAAALSLPPAGATGEEGGASGAGFDHGDIGDEGIRTPRAAAVGEAIHPLASGNATGAVTGLGCALPLVLLMILGFGTIAKLMPILGDLPFYHLVVALGAGIFSMAVMIGVLIAVRQARAGRKLFFLMNMLIGTAFGAGFGAVLDATVGLASGKGLDPAAFLASAAAWGVFAFILSIPLVIVRRIMVFTKEETFGAPMTGLQKAGAALSLVIVLASLYAQGTLTGRVEQAAQGMIQQAQEEITPAGLTVENAHAYVDPGTGDLVITGTIKNTTDRTKPGWYLVVDVYDTARNVVATVTMVNGVQLFTPRDYGILGQRGTDIKELQAKMLLSVPSAVVPAGGSVEFEAHLMAPPAGIASFLPVLKTFDPFAVFEKMANDMERR